MNCKQIPFPHLLIVVLLFSMSMISSAQNTLSFSDNIVWSDDSACFEVNETEKIKTISFDRASFDLLNHSLPIYANRMALPYDGDINVRLTRSNFQAIPSEQLPQLNEVLGEDIVIDASVTYDRKKPHVAFSFIPIRFNSATNQYEKLISFSLTIKVIPNNSDLYKDPVRSYTNNSVFNQDNLYRITLDQDGVYKIDLDLLNDLGVSGTVNINQLRVYGNGGGLLPELSGTEKYDDLVENPVKIVDQNGNGNLDSDDYVLFYGQSPDRWKPVVNSDIFEHEKHVYTEYNAYFISLNIGESQKITIANNSGLTPNQTVTTFNDYAFHEEESRNLIYSGRTWYGEEFNALPEQDVVTFEFPNVVSNSAATIRTKAAARSTSVSSGFTIKVNGETVQSISGLSKVTPGYEQPYGKEAVKTNSFTPNGDAFKINIAYSRPDVSATGWLDYVAMNVRRALTFAGSQMLVRDLASVGEGNISEFQLNNASGTTVWAVNGIHDVEEMTLNGSGSFVTETETLKEFVIFNGENYLSPTPSGQVNRQNLHEDTQPDMVIVVHPGFYDQAEELADFHRFQDNLEVVVVTPQQVYNEFSSGVQDVTAIRDYMKMYYDRAGENEDLLPQHLLLFGDASYDYKNIKFTEADNHNFVPTWESKESIITINTYCTDDFFGFLDDDEGDAMNNPDISLDIAIGRLPVKTVSEAQAVTDKILHYNSTQSFGDWRNNICFVADDEDGNLHFDHAQSHSSVLLNNHRDFNIDKIYIDAYPQISTSGGGRYPTVNEAINQNIFSGTLVMNYVGHGGENGWAHERILQVSDINSWSNLDQLPLFVTATCSFSRYENPDKTSAGELLALSPKGGAIAIVTTTRLVYASSNKRINNDFLERMMVKIDGEMPSIGEITRLAKNDASITKINNRKFALLGDPALKLAVPKNEVVTTSINNQPLTNIPDTLEALSQVTISGAVLNEAGDVMTDFNGVVIPTVFDKQVRFETLGNDDSDDKEDFEVFRNVIFKGLVTVTNGAFEFNFIVPKDIALNYDYGRISYYAHNGIIDANGYTESLVVGGVSQNASVDNEGPQIDLYMNDESFEFGDETNKNPLLIAKIRDENGISTVGGIGHDVVGTLDGNTQNVLRLNNYYQAQQDSYQAGVVEYPLSNLEIGKRYSIEVKAWDVYNNSGTGYTEFIVAEDAAIALQNLLNYPNPMTDMTNFQFDQNRIGEQLEITIQIYTVSGQLIKTIQENIVSTDTTIGNIQWDGTDDMGQNISRGMYIYTIQATTPDGSTALEGERLVILK